MPALALTSWLCIEKKVGWVWAVYDSWRGMAYSWWKRGSFVDVIWHSLVHKSKAPLTKENHRMVQFRIKFVCVRYLSWRRCFRTHTYLPILKVEQTNYQAIYTASYLTRETCAGIIYQGKLNPTLPTSATKETLNHGGPYFCCLVEILSPWELVVC